MILLIVSVDGAAGHQRSCLDGFSDPDIAPTVSSWFPLPFMRTRHGHPWRLAMLRLFRKILGSWKQVDTRTSGLRQRLECCQSPDTSGPPFSCGRTVTCDAHREVHKTVVHPLSFVNDVFQYQNREW